MSKLADHPIVTWPADAADAADAAEPERAARREPIAPLVLARRVFVLAALGVVAWIAVVYGLLLR
jgi:hypothetical protein